MSNKGSDKRSVATDALETLGTAPLDERQKRDAIHLAVEPVIAGCVLPSGMHISVTDGVAMPAIPGEGLGIVDPFLMQPVPKGQRFWFVMYPRMVHSLRHVWAHPAFPDAPAVGAPTPQLVEARAVGHISASKEDSERWLREFCDRSNCPGYESVMKTIGDGSDLEHGLTVRGDASGEIPSEFWLHVEVVLGRKIEHRPDYFSCSC